MSKKYQLIESSDHKIMRSKDYNYNFSKVTGEFARWGATEDDDPEHSEFGPEICDIEISTICDGPDGVPCKFCYKGNTRKGDNMSYQTFVEVFNKLPNTVTQIAFGADATLESNPDVWAIFKHCRDNGVIPNVTVANIDFYYAKLLTKFTGAVAVSRYNNKDWCYNSIKLLTDAGHKQVNIHQLLSEETYDEAIETIYDIVEDPRLSGMKSVVFLSLKPKKRGEKFTRLSQEKFNDIVNIAEDKGISYGFDSCSSNKFIESLTDEGKEEYGQSVEACESCRFSMYIDVHGKYFPCSFTPGIVNDKIGDWTEGLDVRSKDFHSGIWNSEKVVRFRDSLINDKDKNGVHSCRLYWI